MRPAQDRAGGHSATPIYDALYSEYRRSFRALPGDRSGEEDLGFAAFGTGVLGSRAPLSGSAPAQLGATPAPAARTPAASVPGSGPAGTPGAPSRRRCPRDPGGA